MNQVKLQYPEEILISVSGHYCPVVHGGSPVIRSLTFKSNRRTFGPFGVEEGTPFSLSMDGGQIVGFQGRSGWYLDAIGFHLSQTRSTKLFEKVQKKLQKIASMAISAPKDSEATPRVKKNQSMRQWIIIDACYPIVSYNVVLTKQVLYFGVYLFDLLASVCYEKTYSWDLIDV